MQHRFFQNSKGKTLKSGVFAPKLMHFGLFYKLLHLEKFESAYFKYHSFFEKL